LSSSTKVRGFGEDSDGVIEEEEYEYADDDAYEAYVFLDPESPPLNANCEGIDENDLCTSGRGGVVLLENNF